jgi:hypothetical protein
VLGHAPTVERDQLGQPAPFHAMPSHRRSSSRLD